MRSSTSPQLLLPPGLRSPRDGLPPHGANRGSKPSPPRPDTGIGAAIDHRPGQGIVVEHIWPGSPAEAHGVLPGDVILSVDGAIVHSVQVAKKAIRGPEGSTVELRLQRSGVIVETGPIQRGNWVTIAEVDSNLARLKKLASDVRGSHGTALADVTGGLERARNLLDEERARFQGEVLTSKGRETQAELLAKKLSRTLIDASEEMAKRGEREKQMEQRLQEALLSLESVGAERDRLSREVWDLRTKSITASPVSEPLDKSPPTYGLGSLEAALADGIFSPRVGELLAGLESSSMAAKDGGKLSKSMPRKGFLGRQQQPRKQSEEEGSQRIGEMCKELRALLAQEAEMYRSSAASRAAVEAEKERLSKEIASARAVLSQQSSPALGTSDPIPGWKMCIANGEAYYYNPKTGEVRFSPPEGMHGNGGSTDRSVGGDVSQRDTETLTSFRGGAGQQGLSHDCIVWGDTRVPGRRASFGRHVSMEGPVKRAMPYLADSDLAPNSLKGCVALIGRGVCTFTEKAERAAKAGAVGVLFVNHADRLFDVIGHAPHITLPCMGVALSGAEGILDGCIIRFDFEDTTACVAAHMLDSSTISGSRPSPPMLHHATPVEALAEASGKPVWPTSTGSSPRWDRDSASMCSMAMTEEHRNGGSRCSMSTMMTDERNGGSRASTIQVEMLAIASLESAGPKHTSAERAHHHQAGAKPPGLPPRNNSSTAPSLLEAGYGRAAGARTAARGGGAKMGSRSSSSSNRHEWHQYGGSQRWILMQRAVDRTGDVSLPEGWKMRMSRKYDRVFYYNIGTGVRRWTRPVDDRKHAMPTSMPGPEPEHGDEGAVLSQRSSKRDMGSSSSKCDRALATAGRPPSSGKPGSPELRVRARQAGPDAVSQEGPAVIVSSPDLSSRSRGGWSSAAVTPELPSRGRWSILTGQAPGSSVPVFPAHSSERDDVLATPILVTGRPQTISFMGPLTRGSGSSPPSPPTSKGSPFLSAAHPDPRSPQLSPGGHSRESPPTRTSPSARDPEYLSSREIESLPTWPKELLDALGSMGRIVVGDKQIICTRAEFGLQADEPCQGIAAVRGQVVRADPWLADADTLRPQLCKGKVVLIGRGGCPFTIKAQRAHKAGAVAVVIVNNADVLFNVLGQAPDVRIPVVSISKSDAEAMPDGCVASIIWAGESRVAI